MIHYFVWLLVAALYSPIFWDLYSSRWEAIDYTHAYFVLPVSLWIVWQKRKELVRLYAEMKPQRSDFLGLVAIIIGLVLFIFGWRQEYLIVSTISFLLLLGGMIRYLYGTKITKALAFPLFFLIFFIPPPVGMLDSVTMPMRYGISHLVEIILTITGYPITRSGLMLMMGKDEIFMGAPCSGFRSLITMLTLAVAYAYFIKANNLKKIILIPAVIPIALLGNLIRVMILCLVAFYAGHEAAEGFFHDFSGLVMFAITIGSLMGLDYGIDRFQKRGGQKT